MHFFYNKRTWPFTIVIVGFTFNPESARRTTPALSASTIEHLSSERYTVDSTQISKSKARFPKEREENKIVQERKKALNLSNERPNYSREDIPLL